MTYIKSMDYLLAKQDLTINIIASIKEHYANVIHDCSEGIVIYDRPSRTYMVSGESLPVIEGLLESIEHMDECLLCDESAQEYLRNRYHFHVQEQYFQMTYNDQGKQLLQRSKRFSLKHLNEEDTELIVNNYVSHDYYEYVLSRLKAGTMWAGFDADNLVGFIGLHDEGSIGLLQVLDEFQGLGYGPELLKRLADMLYSNGKIVRSQILVTNEASLQAHRKAGFTASEKPVIWFSNL